MAGSTTDGPRATTDGGPRATVASARETLGAMVSTAQTQLRKVFVGFVAAFLLTFWALQAFIWDAMKADLFPSGSRVEVIATTPFDVILLQTKIGMTVGVLVAIVLAVYYSRDALRERGLWPTKHLPRWQAVGLGATAVVLFVGGAAYAYALFFPMLFEFLVMNAVKSGFEPMYSIVKWAQFTFILMLAFGLAAELPLAMSVGVYTDLTTYETLRDYWRHAVVTIVVIASVINGSPDPFSMGLVAAPMIALYAVGLGCSRVVETQVTHGDSGDAAPSSSGSPADLDLDDLSAAGIRSAPPEAFEAMSETEAVEHADRAREEGDPEKAKAILDRFDQERAEDAEGGEPDEGPDDSAPDGRSGDDGTVATTVANVTDAFTDEETSEAEVGGYYHDLAFILESLTSKAFRIVGVFMAVFAVTFTWLYRGGIGWIRRTFLTRLPQRLVGEVNLVALHPIEVLMFETKVSALVGLVAAVPPLLYYAWPALKERGLAGGDRRLLLVWGGTFLSVFLVGSFAGFTYVAPRIVSWLARDAIEAGMVIAYRIRRFGWLVIYTTVGVGLAAEIPATMVLFHHGNLVTYGTMRDHWREVTMAVVVASGVLSPQSVLRMLLLAVPTVAAYLAGLAVLWVVTRFTRPGDPGSTLVPTG